MALLSWPFYHDSILRWYTLGFGGILNGARSDVNFSTPAGANGAPDRRQSRGFIYRRTAGAYHRATTYENRWRKLRSHAYGRSAANGARASARRDRGRLR